ncbi:NAD(P)-dependent malic enzyme [Ammonifex thiophilus]|uniref:NAD-dependent malic enzyme n=1 Tax=Ammonifex thiophilus TaxID=444093 RepID=A0A3D8P507_9THEO|nr:malic enzyme-like NAD(P)-binding protein [Ammonifex thiophilus]RDV84323.1 NAD-dependent malic enzyme [Ammonifex thiophilus]
MALAEEALELHRKYRGKIRVESKVPVKDKRDLSLVYTPGVAAPSEEIASRRELVYEYTAKGNLVAVVTNGTAVLGLGDVGPEAALPVMEGKAVLFKILADVDAFPICLATRNPAEVVQAVKLLAPTFGGINLEDIAAPDCFFIEERLREELDIPVFHDDQHGTAVVVGAALLNALKLTERRLEEIKVVIIGAGAAGIAVAQLLHGLGVRHLLVCDREGILVPGKTSNPYKEAVARLTNPEGRTGGLAEALRGADVLIGLSRGGIVSPEMVAGMAPHPIVFALANPEPEIRPELARQAGAAVIATGRSDYPNQVNNALAFPGVFRGALDVRAREINEAMKLAAVKAIAELVEKPRPDYIIPDPFDPRVVPAVARAVAEAARQTGVARL